MVRIVEMDRPPAAEPRKMPKTVQLKGGHAADIEIAERGPLRGHHGHVPSQQCCGTLRGRAPIDAGRDALEPTAPNIIMDRRARDALRLQPRRIHEQTRRQRREKMVQSLAFLSVHNEPNIVFLNH